MRKTAANVEMQGIEFQIINDSDEASKGLEELSKSLSRLKNSIGGSGTQLNKAAEGIRQIKNAIKDTKLSSFESGMRRISESLKPLGEMKFTSVTSFMKQINAVNPENLEKIAAIDFSNLKEAADAAKAVSGVSGVTSRISSATTGNSMPPLEDAGVAEMPAALMESKQGLQETKEEAEKTTAALRETTKATKENSRAMKEASTSSKGFASCLKDLVKSFGRIVKYRAIRAVIASITSAFKEGTQNLVQYSEALDGMDAANANGTLSQYAAKLLQLKNAIGAAVAPLLNALLPAFNTIANTVIKATNSLNQFFAVLNGQTTYTKAVYNAVDYANSLNGATDAANKLKKSVMGFDELNILPDNNIKGTGSYGISYEDMFEEVNIGKDTTGWMEKLAKTVKELSSVLQPSASEWKTSFSNIGSAVHEFAESAKSDFSNLKEGTLSPFWEYLTAEFVPSIANTFSETFAPIFSDWAVGGIGSFTTEFRNNCALIEEATGWLKEAFEGVDTAFSDMCSSIKEKWDKYGGSIITGFDNLKSGLWDTFWSIYNQIIEPVLNNCAEMISWLWDKHLKPLWDSVVSFVMSITDNLLALWNNGLKPLIDYLWDKASPQITAFINGITDVLAIIVGFVSDTIKNTINMLDGLITFIVGVFTLDFEKAWSGIKKCFSAVFDSFGDIAKSAANSVIWVINQLIAGVYSAIASVINGVGHIVQKFGQLIGVDWGFSVPTDPPKINYFKNGGFPDAGELFIANEAGPELVGTIGGHTAVGNTDQIETAMENAAYRGVRAAMSEGGGSNGGQTRVIVATVDGRVLFDTIVDEARSDTLRTGYNRLVEV